MITPAPGAGQALTWSRGTVTDKMGRAEVGCADETVGVAAAVGPGGFSPPEAGEGDGGWPGVWGAGAEAGGVPVGVGGGGAVVGAP